MSIILYSQPNCAFCVSLKNTMDKTGFTFYEINIQEVPEGKKFLKNKGHKTVPQLYFNDIHLNNKPTNYIDADYLKNQIMKAMNK